MGRKKEKSSPSKCDLVEGASFLPTMLYETREKEVKYCTRILRITQKNSVFPKYLASSLDYNFLPLLVAVKK